jgi:hypothetical protein
VTGAEITLSSVDEQSARTTVSDSDGAYQFMNVKPGQYGINVRAEGFAASRLQGVQLEARQTLREEITLKVASASETIEVGDRAPMINTESATLADTKDWSAKTISTTVPNALLPSNDDRETDRNLILSHNYVITNTLVNEVRFGVSLFRLGVQFPIVGAGAVQKLGLVGLNLSDHPTAGAFPTLNFNDGTGFTPIGRDKAGVTKSQTIQFTDNLSWARGKHTLKVGVDVRRVAYADIESFGGSDDFGAFIFSSGTFSGNAFADFLLGLPAKTYIAQSGPDVLAHTIQTGLDGQDEWRINRRLTLSFGMRWQALPPFVSPLNNLSAFDAHNGGVIIPDHNVPVQGFRESINACSAPYNP